MPYRRNPVNFLSVEVSDDEGMDSMLHCHMQCLEFLPIPVIEICANTSTVIQPFEATDYIPHIEFNRQGEQECGTSQTFEGDDINEDSLEMAQEILNMSTAEPNEELLDDEEFDALIGNDIEDPPSGAGYEDEDFDDNSDGDADDIQPIRYFVPTEAQSLCNVPPNPYDDEWSVGGGEVWNETSNLEKDLVFPDKKSLGEAMKKFSFKRHVNYNVTRSGGKSYEAMCVKHDNGCPWRVRACLKANIGMWLIRKYDGNHCCAAPSVSQDHNKLDSDIIAGLIRGMVERSADVPMSQIIQRVKEEYQFTVSYRKAWLGKQKALAAVYGKWEDSYDTLRRWMRAVQDHLPGTIISFQHRPIPDNDGDVQFHRLFWAFKPCINAWPHLKPVIQVDGTFLYGKYHHTLLIAMGQDGNRNIVPLAFGVCLIFDRSIRCLAAVEDEAVGWQPPLGHHVCCICHVASNFNTKFRSNPLKKLLKNAVHVFQAHVVDKTMRAIYALNDEAGRWLDEIPREKWCRAYDEGRRYGHMTTNLAECMKSVLKGVRSMPITAMVQSTLYKTANYYHIRQQQALAQIHAGHIYCEEFRKSISKHAAVAYACEIKLQNLQDMEFGVQSLRFPCIHVLAVCSYLNHEHELYVDPIYKLHNIVVAYSYPFHPVVGEEYWPEVPGQRLRPNPAALRPPGRPRSTRIHNEMDWKEPGEKPKCSLCRGEGHNKKKCPNKKPIRIFHAGFLEGQKILLHVQRIPSAGDVANRVHCDPLVQRGSVKSWTPRAILVQFPNGGCAGHQLYQICDQVSSVMALFQCHSVDVTSWFEFKGCAWTPLVELWRPCIFPDSLQESPLLDLIQQSEKRPRFRVRAFFCLLNHIQHSRFLTGISTVGSDPTV
ncbi:uncharacterized protein G2W53_014115 [Senna tora]|uniref:Transposase MuDR plant domain-containing protein n=1 Tax=Senna tora TaxID=362788 RepID=A0A834U0G0_9FABA|nr:uncharacterized protein G2W53_014115 [Senna tora]